MGAIPLRVMHTPGHTKDSVSLLLQDRIFVGDLLFLDDGGAGRLDLPGGDVGEHWDSLQRIMGLPDHVIVYPAHDYRSRAPSGIGIQKMRNPFLAPRTRDEYVAFAQTLRYGPAEWMRDVLRLNEECVIPALLAYVMPARGNACENVCESSAGQEDAMLSSVPHISAEVFRAQLQSSAVPALLDVREHDELVGDLPALPDVIHIPVGDIEQRMSELNEYRNSSLVVICRSGKRALRAASLLMQSGFTGVSVLSGGMLALAI